MSAIAPLTTGSAPRVIASDADHKLGSWRSLVMIEFITIPSKSRVSAMEKTIRDSGKTEGQVTVIVRVHAPMKIPPQEIREQITGVIRETEPITTGWAVILEGDGFWAAAHRTFSTSMHMLSRSKVKMRIFKNVDLAARWAAELSNESHVDIARVMDTLNRS